LPSLIGLCDDRNHEICRHRQYRVQNILSVTLAKDFTVTAHITELTTKKGRDALRPIPACYARTCWTIWYDGLY